MNIRKEQSKGNNNLTDKRGERPGMTSTTLPVIQRAHQFIIHHFFLIIIQFFFQISLLQISFPFWFPHNFLFCDLNRRGLVLLLSKVVEYVGFVEIRSIVLKQLFQNLIVRYQSIRCKILQSVECSQNFKLPIMNSGKASMSFHE